MGENPVRRKLRTSIVPQIVLASKLKKQSFYWVNQTYTFFNTVTIILIGTGIFSQDILGFITNSQTTTLESQSSLAFKYQVLIAVAIISWAFLKAYVSIENTPKKYELAKSCQQRFRKIDSKLDDILAQSNPISQLESLRKNIEFARDAAEDAWVYTTLEPEKYKNEINENLNSLCERFETYWTNEVEMERIEK